ncbi:MAG: aldo/keto reductase [Polyangiaceae bacterium]
MSNLNPSIAQYRLLGRTGLRVSPFCLGTMTFGTEWGWGAPQETAFALMDRFAEAGGNFIDTADGYTNGTSETMVGAWIKARNARDRTVVATKFTFNASPGDPNAGGNGRKNIRRALEGSLRRLGTDYIDLYWLHAWDTLTPVEEVMSTLTDLVHEGKVRYIGFSDTPAWYAARAQTLAETRGYERLAALQLEYSLVERNIEREHVPLAAELGMGLCPWSPLASGMLTGKHKREAHDGESRLNKIKDAGNPAFTKLFSDRNWDIVEALVRVSSEIGRSPAQVALSWLFRKQTVASIILGATKLTQLEDNLSSISVELPDAAFDELDKLSSPEVVHPYLFFTQPMQAMINGGTSIRDSAHYLNKR